jgi:hypothetical protein
LLRVSAQPVREHENSLRVDAKSMRERAQFMRGECLFDFLVKIDRFFHKNVSFAIMEPQKGGKR